MTKIELKHPITADGREVAELTLRRPKVRDLERMDKVSGEMAKAVTMIADLAEIAPDQVRELDAEDFAAAAEALGDFLAVGPPTSGKPSAT
ncbi:MAG: phage tail assembly protein [Bryobacterales bacterium]|nr:phage tail assembly protein [Bryobacterales bacterium]MDE0296950.1 phage tail assembly protein [Bryobacterales bacterium]